MSSQNREKAMSILKMAKISDSPVDVAKVASVLGFRVIQYPFPDKLKGKVTVVNGVKVIGVNKNHPSSLQRYTIAHELGHYLNGHEHYEKDSTESENPYYDHYFQQEREADLFAAELLMPKEYLEKDLTKIGIDIQKLIEKYEVSEQALWIRLTSTGLAEKFQKKTA